MYLKDEEGDHSLYGSSGEVGIESVEAESGEGEGNEGTEKNVDDDTIFAGVTSVQCLCYPPPVITWVLVWVEHDEGG